MTFTTIPAEPWFAQFPARSVIRAHDMRQFVQAGLLACADAASAVCADLDPARNCVGVAAPRSAHHGYRVGVGRERKAERVRLLDGDDLCCAIAMADYAIVHDQCQSGFFAADTGSTAW